MERNIQEDPLLHINRIWGPKVQAKALYEMVHNGLSSRELAERNPHFASDRTYRRLYRHFQLYGEIPHQTAMRKKRNRLKVHRRQMPMDVQTILLQRARVYPTSYLHEFQTFLDVNNFGYYSIKTIERVLQDANLSRAVLARNAIQQDAMRQQAFLDQISLIQSIDMFIMVDETHKDRKAGSRRYGWGERGSLHLVMEVFNNPVEKLYTVIAAADVNGFIEEACQTVLRPATVNTDMKLAYIENFLLPVLGRFDNLEPRSVVTMDNASINEKLAIERMINSVGAIIIWNAPFSPQYHPIERAFKDYKDDLKSNTDNEGRSWYDTHLKALRSVRREKMMKYICSAWGFPNKDEDDNDVKTLVQILLLAAVVVCLIS